MIEEYAPLFAYIVRSLMEGGALAAKFVDGLVDDADAYLEAGEQAGTVRPSDDPHGRSRTLVATQVGLIVMAQLDAAAGRGTAPTDDPAAAMKELYAATLLAGLELYTHGLFTDSGYLDAYREFRKGEVMTDAIHIRGLVKSFGAKRALDGFDLSVAHGRGARVPRPERRGQVDDDPRAARAAAGRRRRREPARRRPVEGRGRAAPAAGLRAGRREPVAQPVRRRGDRRARSAARRPRPAKTERARSSGSSSTRGSRAAPTPRATGRRSRSSRRWPPTPSCT